VRKIILLFLIVHCTLSIEDCMCQWVQVSNGIGNGTSVYALGNNGTNIFAGTENNGVYITTNYGNSFAQTSFNNQSVYNFAISNNKIFAGSSDVYLSSNNGANWIQTNLSSGSPSISISGNNIFAATYYGVYRSTNDGVNWIITSLNNLVTYSVASLGNKIFAGTLDSGVYFSTNNGINWIRSELNNQVAWIFAVSGNNIYAGTLSYGLFISTNSGINWTQSSLNNKDILSIAVYANNIFAGTSNNGIYLSTNNGINWIQKNQGFNISMGIRALLITNNYIFAGCTLNSIWRRELGEIIGIKNISSNVPEKFSLPQNYPNPFNPTTSIKYNIPKLSSPHVLGGDLVLLKVYNILGKEVATLVNEKQSPGTYEVTFDGSQYPSGIYFYKLETQSYKETKRMVLIK
jgi:hypothetical protein